MQWFNSKILIQSKRTIPNCKRLPSHTGQEHACTRITRLFGYSVVCSSPCRKWPNTEENGCWVPPSDHIKSETQTTRPGKMVQPVSCTGSCSFSFHKTDPWPDYLVQVLHPLRKPGWLCLQLGARPLVEEDQVGHSEEKYWKIRWEGFFYNL